jgi:hypothetical protein
MEYLISYSLFELKTSTYISAANKLQSSHPKRAKDLRKWAHERENDIDYLDPRPFEIAGDYYYVVGVVDGTKGSSPSSYINVEMKSANDIILASLLSKSDDSGMFEPILITAYYKNGHYNEERNKDINLWSSGSPYGGFRFKNRKDARTFVQIIENELGRKLNIPLNKIYKSE